MDENQCELHREHLKHQIDTNERRINNHSDRIDKLEQYRAGVEKQIESLVEQIKDLVTSIKWIMGLLITSLVGFFFYVIQQAIK